MGLRIKSNLSSLEVQRNLKNSDRLQASEFAKLASGKRITKSADDAAGLGIAKKMEAEVRGYRMAARNASNGVSMIQVAEGGLNESTNILTRLRELSIQAASDTVGEKERGYLDLEYGQLVEEFDRIAKTTTFGGAELLTGNNENGIMEVHVGAYAGENNRISIDTENTIATADAMSLEGTSISEKDGARDNLGLIDEAIDKISGFRAGFGSMQSRLQSTISNLDTMAVNTEAARSNIEDVDVASSSAKLASLQVMKQAGIATLAQANNLPGSALRLIG